MTAAVLLGLRKLSKCIRRDRAVRRGDRSRIRHCHGFSRNEPLHVPTRRESACAVKGRSAHVACAARRLGHRHAGARGAGCCSRGPDRDRQGHDSPRRLRIGVCGHRAACRGRRLRDPESLAITGSFVRSKKKAAFARALSDECFERSRSSLLRRALRDRCPAVFEGGSGQPARMSRISAALWALRVARRISFMA